MDKRVRRFLLALAAACALIAGLHAAGLLRRQRVFADMTYTSLAFTGEGSARTADEGYGPMNAGPGVSLDVGEYTLRITYDGDGDNHVELSALNGARMEPSRIRLPAGGGTVEARFAVTAPADRLQIVFCFDAGTRLDVQDVRMYSPFYRDGLFLAIALCAAVFGLWLLHLRGLLTPERRGVLTLLGLAALIACAPALKDTIGVGYDTRYHLVRLYNLADGLASGQFPVRVGGFSHNGYGAMISVFYPDAFLYPFALLINLGASAQFALNGLLVCVNLLTAWTMYASARRMFGSREGACCAAVLYQLSTYRVYDVYTRCAVGEMLAMAFLPVFILGLYEVVLGDKARWRTLALGAAGVFLSHMLSTAICAALAAGVCLLFVVRIVRERRLLPLVKAAALAAGLCAFQLVPLAMMSREGLGVSGMERVLTYFDLQPAQLFLNHVTIEEWWDEHMIQYSVTLGFPLVMAAGLTVCSLAHDGLGRRGRTALLMLAGGALFAFAGTNLFPWSYVSVATGGLVDYIQFPWRLLMLATAFFALAGGYGVVRFGQGQSRVMLALALCVGAVAVLPTLTQEARVTDIIDYGEIASPDLWVTDYLPEGTDMEKTADTAPHADGAQITAYEKQGTAIDAHAVSEAGGSVSFPLFGLTGYRVTLSGEEVAWQRGENNRITVTLPAGTDADLAVRYVVPPLWRAADVVSLATVLALCARARRRRARAA